MDELEFRRKVYADPDCEDQDFLHALDADTNLEDVVADLKDLNNKIDNALKIDVPTDLEEKLRQQPNVCQLHKVRRKNRAYIALAASITLVVGLTFTMLRLTPVDMGENALAHVYHEEKAMRADADIPYEQVNAQLASVKVLPKMSFSKQPGKITYTTYCDFKGVRGLHLVMEGKQDNVAVFIFPKESRMKLQASFADDKYKGEVIEQDDAYLIFVGKQDQDLEVVRKEVQNTLI